MIEEKNVNTEANPKQADNASPAVNQGEAGKGKTFTQDEVNRIVSERLAREREKQAAEPSETDKREQELNARESAFKCRELIAENDCYPKELLDILDTSNFDAFKRLADKLIEAFPLINPKTPHFVPQFSGPTPGSGFNDKIAEAFRPKI